MNTNDAKGLFIHDSPFQSAANLIVGLGGFFAGPPVGAHVWSRRPPARYGEPAAISTTVIKRSDPMRSDLCLAILLIAAAAILQVPGAALCETPPDVRPNAVGMAVGVPQTVAVAYWRTLTPRVQIHAYAGSAVLFSSAGARVQFGFREKVLRPYAFAGYAVIYSVGQESDSPSGVSGYLWLGPGLSLCSRRWALFAEGCALLGGDEHRGLGDRTWIFPFDPAISGGLTCRYLYD